MAQEEKKIYVYENWSSEIPRELGILYVNNVRVTEIFSFEYNEEYLRNPTSCSIDPEFPNRAAHFLSKDSIDPAVAAYIFLQR
ncbi:hypothetical protein J5834_03825 [bacterium]|nr:hypothetical protein [bacterium]